MFIELMDVFFKGKLCFVFLGCCGDSIFVKNILIILIYGMKVLKSYVNLDCDFLLVWMEFVGCNK